ncbi:MAG: hypothetical protein ABEJ65_03570, partial [bacterium]
MKKTLLGYVPEESPVYWFHPFTRLWIITMLTFIPLVILSWPVNLTITLLFILLFPISRIRLSVFRYYLPIFGMLFLFISAVYTFFPSA